MLKILALTRTLKFEECTEKVLGEEKEIYLLGDINRDLLNNHI